MTLSMPYVCSSWPSSRPAGPAPMMATCVRMRAVPRGSFREHDPEKWTPVFGRDHAQTRLADGLRTADRVAESDNGESMAQNRGATPAVSAATHHAPQAGHGEDDEDRSGQHRAGAKDEAAEHVVDLSAADERPDKPKVPFAR